MTQLYPQFRGVPVVQQWGGYIDVTPDVVPYISPLGTLPGLTVADGILRAWIRHRARPPDGWPLNSPSAQTPSVDPTPFRASRFSDGSPIVIGPEI